MKTNKKSERQEAKVFILMDELNRQPANTQPDTQDKTTPPTLTQDHSDYCPENVKCMYCVTTWIRRVQHATLVFELLSPLRPVDPQQSNTM
jgi:hypothetical protein